MKIKQLLTVALMAIGWSNAVFAEDNYTNVYSKTVSEWTESDLTDWGANANLTIDAERGLGFDCNLYGGVNATASKTFTITKDAKVKYEVDWNYGSSLSNANNYSYLQFGDKIRLGWYGGGYRMNLSTDGGASYGITSGIQAGSNTTYTTKITIILNSATNAVESFVFGTTDLTNMVSSVVLSNCNTVTFGFTRGGRGGNWNVPCRVKDIAVSECKQEVDYDALYNKAKSTYTSRIAALNTAGQTYWNTNLPVLPATPTASEYNAAVNALPGLYVESLVAQGEGTDISELIVNAGCDTDFTGWIKQAANGNNQMMGASAFEYWGYNSNNTSNFDYYQTVSNLPSGKYKVSARMYNDQTHDGFEFSPCFGVYASNGAKEVSKAVDQRGTEYAWYETAEIAVTEGSLRVGVKNLVAVLNTRWCVVDEFKLTYVGPITNDDVARTNYEDALTDARAVQDAWVGKVGRVFQHTTAAYEALGNAITDAENAAPSNESEYNTQTEAINTAVSTFNSSALVQPDGEKFYRLYLAQNGSSTGLNLNTLKGVNKILQVTSAPSAVKIVPVANGYNIRDVYGNNIVHAKSSTWTWGTANADFSAQGDTRGERFTAALNANGTVTLTSAYAIVQLGADGFVDGSYVGRNANTQWLVEEVEVVDASMAVNEIAKYGTFCAPFDVLIPADVTAGIATVDGNTINIANIETGVIPANTPVILYAESGLAENTLKGVEVAGTPTAGVLTGTYSQIAAPNGSYILQNHDDEGVGFYQVNTDEATPNVPANRCYLTVGGGANVRAFFFDAETAISAIEALTSGKAEIYNLNGVKLNSLQKGINIVNGKKIMVK